MPPLANVLIYGASLFLYGLFNMVSYSTQFQKHILFFPAGLAIVLMNNSLWFYLARSSASGSDLFVKRIVWDIMAAVPALLIPLLLYRVSPSPYQIAGAIVISFGAILMGMK